MRSSLVEAALGVVCLALIVGSAAPSKGKRMNQPTAGRTSWDRHALWASSTSSANGGVDADSDGIDDAAELSLAKAYFPYFSVDTSDACGRHGVLFRLTPHPLDSKKIAIRYVVLFERDCGRLGLGGHVGDDENFSAIVDPNVAPPAGILALRAVSHRKTAFQRQTSCGSLAGCSPCNTADIGGNAYPIVFASSNKHGNYVSQLACNTWPNDLGSCWLNGAPDEPPFTNAGEPGRPLARDLTSDGFIKQENGWTEPSLMHFDPWSDRKFGTASKVAEDLVNDVFLIAPSGC